MVKYEDRCCGCAAPGYPCAGSACPNRNVKVVYCDCCGEEIEGDVYTDDAHEHLCEDCLHRLYLKEDEE